MNRLPFDPTRASGAPAPPAPDRAECLTVRELSELIKGTLEQKLSNVRVIGEVSNLSTSHHWYFSLKDGEARVDCVAWASTARRFGFEPSDGDEVIATGYVSHYAPQGRTQLYVQALQPVGAGELERRFRAMCEELRALGYFDEDRKKPLPLLPRRVAVITSAGSAAVQDVVSTAAHRCPAVRLLVVNCRVQGDGAAAEIARAVRRVDREHERLGIDVIIVTRGGGSIEDLWAFNERLVADAVYGCRLPVVAAIGHESDTTVIELVADLRASTPTQAAMRVIPEAVELQRQVDHLEHRLCFLVRRHVEQGRQRLHVLSGHELFRMPGRLVQRAAERLDSLRRHLVQSLRRRVAEQRARLERLAGHWGRLQPASLVADRHRGLAALEDRLHRAALHAAERARQRIEQYERQLTALDPREVLSRGYSYTTNAAGSLVRVVGDVAGGDELVTHVSDGRIHSVVGGATRRRRPKHSGDTQPDLFPPDG